MYFDSPRMPLSCYARGAKEKQKNDEPASTTVRPWWMTLSVVSLFLAWLFIFLWLFNFRAVFNVIYTRGCSTSSSFSMNGGSHPHFNIHHPIPFLFLSSSGLGF